MVRFKFRQANKGFGLLEVLIAMAVITIGLVAALNLTAFSLHSYKTNSQQVIDANFVQGCVEQVRNARDTGQGVSPPAAPCLCNTTDMGDYYYVRCWQNNTAIVTYLYDWR